MFDWDLLEDNRKKDVFVGKLNISEGYRRKCQPIIDKINFHSAMRSFEYDEMERYGRDNDFLEDLYSTLNEKQIELIKYEISQSEGGSGFEMISDIPSWEAEWRKGYDKPLMQVWVDQSVGCCEDDYYGYVYVEIIPDKKYLKWFYSM